MTGRKLPPLLAGGWYTCPPLTDLDFTPPDLDRELTGEATSLLRLTLSNEVNLEVPLRMFQLQMLICSLMRAFPQQALANLMLCGEQEETDPDRTRGAQKN